MSERKLKSRMKEVVVYGVILLAIGIVSLLILLLSKQNVLFGLLSLIPLLVGVVFIVLGIKELKVKNNRY